MDEKEKQKRGRSKIDADFTEQLSLAALLNQVYVDSPGRAGSPLGES